MELEEIQRRIERISRDFSPLIPGLKVEFLSSEAYMARLRGKPIMPWEAGKKVKVDAPPLHSSIKNNQVLVCREALLEAVHREPRELRRPLVEGLILYELLYLAVARGPEMYPRARAEAILRRYWPLQYCALQGIIIGGKAEDKPEESA
ncbi:MAG: hypothetical protein WHT46_06105 [Candidatus Geothermincolales bacterium]